MPTFSDNPTDPIPGEAPEAPSSADDPGSAAGADDAPTGPPAPLSPPPLETEDPVIDPDHLAGRGIRPERAIEGATEALRLALAGAEFRDPGAVPPAATLRGQRRSRAEEKKRRSSREGERRLLHGRAEAILQRNRNPRMAGKQAAKELRKALGKDKLTDHYHDTVRRAGLDPWLAEKTALMAMRNIPDTGDLRRAIEDAVAFHLNRMTDEEIARHKANLNPFDDDEPVLSGGTEMVALTGDGGDGRLADNQPIADDPSRGMDNQVAQTPPAAASAGSSAPDPKRIGDPSYLYDWPGSTLTPEFRDAIAKAESNTKGYREVNPGKAWGRYQMTDFGLHEAGMKDSNKNWTGKHGVKSEHDFLSDPVAQEKAFDEYMRNTVNQLKAKGALNHLGRGVDGIKGRFTINRDNLAAAAHRHGAGRVNRYLKHQSRNNWKTDETNMPTGDRSAFLAIETRLRMFEIVKYARKPQKP